MARIHDADQITLREVLLVSRDEEVGFAGEGDVSEALVVRIWKPLGEIGILDESAAPFDELKKPFQPFSLEGELRSKEYLPVFGDDSVVVEEQ